MTQRYPAELEDVVNTNYELDDLQVLVEKSGGNWGQVAQDNKKQNAIHHTLSYICKNAEHLCRLRNVIDGNGYMTDDVARSIDDHLVMLVGSTPASLTTQEILRHAAEALTRVYPEVDVARLLCTQAGVSEQRITELTWSYPSDAVATWRSLLIVAAFDERLLAVVRQAKEGNPNDSVVAALLSRLEGSLRDPEQNMNKGSSLPKPARPAENPASKPKPREEMRDRVRLAEQRSALKALETVHELMDEALEKFARKDAKGASVPAGFQSLEDYTDAVSDLCEEIARMGYGETNADGLLEVLQTLISTVWDGIHAAEAAEDFQKVADLADDAARAYGSVAEALRDDTGDIFERVIPYWEMKGAHARHQAKVCQEKRRLSRSAGAVERERSNVGNRPVSEAQRPTRLENVSETQPHSMLENPMSRSKILSTAGWSRQPLDPTEKSRQNAKGKP